MCVYFTTASAISCDIVATDDRRVSSYRSDWPALSAGLNVARRSSGHTSCTNHLPFSGCRAPFCIGARHCSYTAATLHSKPNRNTTSWCLTSAQRTGLEWTGLVLPHCWRSKVKASDTWFLHTWEAQIYVTVKSNVQSSMTSVQSLLLRLLCLLVPSIRLWRIAVRKLSAHTTWPKYCNFIFVDGVADRLIRIYCDDELKIKEKEVWINIRVHKSLQKYVKWFQFNGTIK